MRKNEIHIGARFRTREGAPNPKTVELVHFDPTSDLAICRDIVSGKHHSMRVRSLHATYVTLPAPNGHQAALDATERLLARLDAIVSELASIESDIRGLKGTP